MTSQNKKIFLLAIALGLSLALVFASINSQKLERPSQNKPEIAQLPPTDSQTTRFAIPIDCKLGDDCFIMHYVDRDPTAKEIDFGCGRQTYDGHKGTDFAISDLQKMMQGVPVIAAADGTVLRVRDGIADKLVRDRADVEAVGDIKCGNGVVIDHGNGWETQYCHLRNGSIAISPNTKVTKGTTLGMVGSSGLASFPHVHLTLRYRGTVVDPFVGVDSTPGCEVDRNALWEESLDYVPTGLIEAGFANKAPNQAEIWQGKFSGISLSQRSPALVFWVHAFGVLAGDKEIFKLTTPDGKVQIDRENNLEKPFRSWVTFVGKSNKDGNSLRSGVWRGQYKLMRRDSLVFQVDREIRVN